MSTLSLLLAAAHTPVELMCFDFFPSFRSNLARPRFSFTYGRTLYRVDVVAASGNTGITIVMTFPVQSNINSLDDLSLQFTLRGVDHSLAFADANKELNNGVFQATWVSGRSSSLSGTIPMSICEGAPPSTGATPIPFVPNPPPPPIEGEYIFLASNFRQGLPVAHISSDISPS